MQFQHYVQRAYLERWKTGKHLYLFDKHTGAMSPKQAAKSIMGFENLQSEAMENAFRKVEECVGKTDHLGEITDPDAIRLFAEWIALHRVRNALNAAELGRTDYAPLVKQIASGLESCYGMFMDFTGDVFITGDNPIVEISDHKESFYFATLSPRRCLYLMREDKMPLGENGRPGWLPPTINWYVYRAATRFCVSFDKELHVEDLPQASQQIDDPD